MVGRILPLGVFIGWVVGCAAPALAADSAAAPQPSTATVSFVDDRPLSLSYAEITDKGGLRVLVHNDARRAQDITVRVIGLADSDDPAVQTFLSDQPVTKADLPPGGSALAEIALGEPMEDLDAAPAASALLVANGEFGGLARRPLELTAASSAPGPGAPDQLSPTFAPDLTLTAVNYLPSPLGSLRPTLFLLAALAAAIALALRAGIVATTGALTQANAWIVAGLLALIGLIWTAADRDWTPGTSVHAISARPIEVAEGVAPGVVGFVSAGDGAVARLEVDAGSELRPQRLTGAASYSGPYDLAPGDDEDGAKATVNVRDWWPLAALVLGLGVALGAWLRNWYQRVRPKAALSIRLADLLADAMSLQASASAAGVDLGQVLGGKIAELVGDLRQLAADDDLAGAGKKLDALEAQLRRLVAICTAVVDLAARVEETKALAQQVQFEEFDVRLLARAQRLIRSAVSSIDLTALDPDELKATLAQLEETSGWLARIGALYASALAHRERAVEMLRANPHDPKTKEALQTLRKDFDEIMLTALQANSSEELDAAEASDDLKRRLLARLAGDVFDRPIGTVVLGVDMWPLPTLLAARLHDAGETLDSVEGVSAVTPKRSATISVTPVTVDDSDPQIRVEDTVACVAQLSPWTPEQVGEVEFRYSDGTTRTAQVSPAGTAADYRVIRAAGTVTVSVHSKPEGDQLATRTFEALPVSRRASARSALRSRDRDIARIATVLAVGSGLLSLYVTDPAWGEASDYLAAALWGAVTAEGVKLAVAVADRVWPAG